MRFKKKFEKKILQLLNFNFSTFGGLLSRLWKNNCIHIFVWYGFIIIEIFKWSIIIFSKVNFVFKHWNRRILYFSTCKYLSFNHCRNISFSVSKTNLDGFVFSNILKFIKLRNGLFLSCAHWKMSIFYNNFIVKFINLFLFLLL